MLVFLGSLFFFQSVYAFNISNPNVTLGDTISFEKRVCTRGSNPKFFIQEPSGRFVLFPEYVNVSIERGESCGTLGRRYYYINGTIKITEELQKGEYIINTRFSRPIRDYIFKDSFFVDFVDWRYSFQEEYGWNQKNFNDSNWKNGNMPFGNSNLFYNINIHNIIPSS